ncbi:MAG: RIP metalloprotease RseP [Pseudomonadota bacterium]
MNLLHTLLSFAVALGVLIVVHEFGHYLVARWCGVKVLRFSVGFGKPIFMRRLGRDRTEWAIAAIPLGGYVKMLDEREGEVAPEELPRAFNRQNVWKRFAIVAAGPLANFLLAIVLYAVLFVGGVQELKPIAGKPVEGSLAAAAGIREGDTVTAVDGEAVRSWQDVRWALLDRAIDREPVTLEVITADRTLERRVLDLSGLHADQSEGDLLLQIGLRAYRPPVEPVVGQVSAGSPAERAGLRLGDRIVAIDDEPVTHWDTLVDRVRNAPGRELRLTVERDGQRLQLYPVPDAVGEGEARRGRLGVAPQVDEAQLQPYFVEIRYGVVEAFGRALEKTWDTSVFSLRMLGKMVLGEVSWRNLSGPVTIADYAGQSAQLGLAAYLSFLALISISLGVLNLLPIPLLDGGHLMYYTAEILKGSPVSERIVELGQRAGLVVLLALMVFAFYNDISRLLTG